MDSRSLISILGILRRFKMAGHGHSTYQVVKSVVGDHANDATVFRICANVVELTSVATANIQNSKLDDEAKTGLIATIQGVGRAFSMDGVQSQWQSCMGDVNSAISNLVILLSAVGIPPNPSTPDEAATLAQEIEEFCATLGDYQLDPITADIVLRHLTILATLLRHIPVFGMDAAMVTYFELMMAMKKEFDPSSSQSKDKRQEFWDKLTTWSGRLGEIETVWGTCTSILANPVVQSLLSFAR